MPLLLRHRKPDHHRKHATSGDPSPSLTPGHAANESPSWLAAPDNIQRPHSEGRLTASRLSHELLADDIDEASATDHEGKRPNKRFSMMRLTRNYSESNLSARAKMERESELLPPVPSVTADGVLPTIVKTAPTMENALGEAQEVQQPVEEEHRVRPSLFKRASSRGRESPQKQGRKSTDERRTEKRTPMRWRRGKTSGLEDLHRLSTLNTGSNQPAPPSYGDDSNSALAVPLSQLANPRFSESSRSDGSNGSSGDGHIYGSTTTTTHTVSTHTTFFRLPRRNKNRSSLFPLPVKIPPPDKLQELDEQGPATPRAPSQSHTPEIHETPEIEHRTPPGIRRRHTETSPVKLRPHSQSLTSPHAALAKTSLSFAEPGMNLFRHNSQRSLNSATSSPLQPPMRLGLRDRSSTASSWGRSSQDVGTPPPLSASGRNSTSTTGRSSFGGFLNLSRFRQNSEPHSPRHGSPGTRSKSNSFAISREALVIPEREEGDTPGKYLERLESAVSRSVIAGILSKSGDPFAAAVLRSYTRRFPFFGEPIDMSLRKFLLEAELPKETQQVDRVIQAFADRYNECNPGIFSSSDQAYVIAFSIMMLHTDAFNKNNKRKMQKADYIKNTSGQGLSDDILACFYDNICYTPFVHYEEDVDINGEKVLPFKTKKSSGKLKSAIPGSDVAKKASGPVDPYNLLVEQKLDTLRPSIKEQIMLDDPYDYRGSSGDMDAQYLQRAFTHTGILQIISARSRPAAYESQFVNGTHTPTESQQGIVDLKITKVGALWRKSSKKKKTRSPWQEWGAILTGSQLYLFRNSHWAKGLMNQFMHHQRPNQPRTPVVFKPPLTEFKPDALIKTDNAVALVDHTYTRHKNAFTFIRPGGQEEVFLADNESELNDWLALINYAAAFRAAGVRIRGMLGGTEEDIRNRGVRRIESTASTRSIQSKNGEVTVQNRGLSPQLQRQVMAARRQLMVQKVGEIEKEITDANKQLESMLRSGRHLLILAPIAPKTRENVIHSAARADAMIKWLRRDIWRMKCHRDIIAMDVRLDGLSASELEKLAQDHAQQAEPESAKKENPKMLARLSSSKARDAKSPPQSPLVVHTGGRPSTTGSLDAVNGDIFRTPPESASSPKEEGWRLPPLSLDQTASADQHRPSVASTFLTASSPGTGTLRDGSILSSSASSMLEAQRTHSTAPSDSIDGRSKEAVYTVDDRELALMARSTAGPAQSDSTRGAGPDGTPIKPSPDHKHKGVRRSLQKTLRDAHHHSGHGHHRHRRNKDSDSTVRSAGLEDRDTEESTPGLQREKPRFILHGKQASVVQFGGDWERMKLRREQYESQHPSSPTHARVHNAFEEYERRQSEQHELLRSSMVSPDVRNSSISEADDDEDDTASMLSAVSGFREDAEAAAAYTAMVEPSSSPTDGARPESEYFDLSPWGVDDYDRRQTVIGPGSPLRTPKAADYRHRRRLSTLQKDENGTLRVIDSDDDQDEVEHHQSPVSPNAREDRRTTVLWNGNGKGRDNAASSAAEAAFASSATTTTTAESGAVSLGGDGDSVEGEHGFVQPISDDELRKMSSSLNAVAPLLL